MAENKQQSQYIFIRNNEPRIHGLAFCGGRLDLKPGINRVERTVWDKVKGDSINKFRLSRGSLGPGRAVFEELDGPEKGLTTSLISDTYDRELLRKWLESERSPETVRAIQAQLARIAPAAPNVAPIVPGMEPEHAKQQAEKVQAEK
jgi:hypothetical protein